MKQIKRILGLGIILALLGGIGAAAAEPVSIKGFGLTTAYTDVMEQIAADYKAETGVTLEWEIAGEDYSAVLKTRFAAEEAPDIFDLTGNEIFTWSERCADLTGAEFLDHLLESSKEYITVDGKQLAMPYAMEASGLLYNKALFAQAGIEAFPTTLDELEEACKTLQANGIQAFGEAWKEWGFLMHIFGTPFAYEPDLPAFTAKLNSGEAQLKDLAYIDNFFRLFDMTLTYGKGVESIGYSVMDQYPDFAAGKMAIIKQGTWLGSPILAANPDIDMGLAAVPLNGNPEDTKLMVATTRYFAVNKESPVAEEAAAFLDWLYRNIQKYFVDQLQVVAPFDNIDTSNLGVLNMDMYAYEQAGMAYPSFGTDLWPAGFQVDIAEPLQAYAAGAMDKETALAELQRLYESRLATN